MTKAAELAKMGEVLTNSQIGGRRNIIINGAMNVAQRSTSVTGVGDTDGYFTCDRWGVYQGNTAGRLTMTQTADGPSGFANCMKLDCTTADTSIAAGEFFILRQSLEGQDVQQLKYGTSDAEKITVSFYVKGNASAKYTCELQNNDNTRTIAQTFDVTTSWSRVVLTFNADTSQGFDDDNVISLTMLLWLHAGSNFTGGTFVSNTWADTVTNKRVGDSVTSFFDSTDRTFFITGVQMEVGSKATPFEHRSYGEELALCQRYYNVLERANGNVHGLVGYVHTTSSCMYPLHKTMRTTPSMTNTNFQILYAGTTTVNISSISSIIAENCIVGFKLNCSGTPLTIGEATMLSANGDSKLEFSAEL